MRTARNDEVIAQNERNKNLGVGKQMFCSFFPQKEHESNTNGCCESRTGLCTLLTAVPEIHTMWRTSKFTSYADCTYRPFLLHNSTTLKCISNGCLWTVCTYMIHWRSILKKYNVVINSSTYVCKFNCVWQTKQEGQYIEIFILRCMDGHYILRVKWWMNYSIFQQCCWKSQIKKESIVHWANLTKKCK